MKTKLFIIGFTAVLTLSQTALAAPVPAECVPEGADKGSVIVANNLIGDVLDNVTDGMGFADASNKATSVIYKAVLNHETDSYGYAVLTAISDNAIRYYRDLYMRPEYYAASEGKIRPLIADLIAALQNGSMDYKTAKDTAYTRIYQSVCPSYVPNPDVCIDICYLDIPSIDYSMFTVARKLLLAAIPVTE